MNEDININQLAPEKPEKQTQANWQLCFDKKNRQRCEVRNFES